MDTEHYRKQIKGKDRLQIDGKTIWIPRPDGVSKQKKIPRPDIFDRIIATREPIDGIPPMHFRLFGPSGSGKSVLIDMYAEELGLDLYKMSGSEVRDSNDLVGMMFYTPQRNIEYDASPLYAAVMRGGLFCLDEMGKLPQDSLSVLASVLDDQRALKSHSGLPDLNVHPNFQFCATLQEDEEKSGAVGEFLRSRTDPALYVGHPSPPLLESMLRARLSVAADVWFRVFMKHFAVGISARRAFNLLSYAHRLCTLAKNSKPTQTEVLGYLKMAAENVRIDHEGEEVI